MLSVDSDRKERAADLKLMRKDQSKHKRRFRPEIMVICLLIAAVASGGIYTAVSGYRSSHLSEAQLLKFREAFDLPQNFMNVASANCCGKTENTLEAINAGYKSGAGYLEVNVAFRKDGVPVLARGNAFVTERSATLESVFKFVKKYSYMKVLLNLKELTNLDGVVALIGEYGLTENVFISDIDGNSAGYIIENYPSLYLFFKVPDGADLGEEKVRAALVDDALKYSACGFVCGIDTYTAEFGALLKEKNLYCILSGANNKYQLYSALSLNPNGILTTRPDLLFEIMTSEKLFG